MSGIKTTPYFKFILWNADFCGFLRIWRILKAWNADFRGFNGFSRILSGVFIKIR
ncbi:MAG: hypothetical protein FWG87_01105 [Defluviitaleaceae bacterium]|nr:hypothetical protein [Defluviitaleaceae bacterium]